MGKKLIVPAIVDVDKEVINGLRCSKECDNTTYYPGHATQILSETKRRKLKLLICTRCGSKYVTKTKVK